MTIQISVKDQREHLIQLLDRRLIDHFDGYCFGLRDWRAHFGVVPGDEELAKLEAVDLKVVPPYDTFGYWSIGALSIMAWHDICAERDLPGFYHLPPWYDNYAFANTPNSASLCAMPVAPSLTTFNLPWEEQLKDLVLAPQSIVLPAVQVVTWNILFQAKTGRFATADHWLRCADQYLPDSRVLVGKFGPHGLGITGHVFVKPHPRVALATGWLV